MIYVPTPEQMAAIDRATIEQVGLPGAVLMENAGRAVATEVASRTPAGGAVAVVCGRGNNGGDGYVVARCLRARGIEAVVYLAAPRGCVAGDAALHLGVLERSGGRVVSIADAAALAAHAGAIEGADVVVDCVFGTGLARPVDGHLADVIGAINRGRGLRVAVDVPSGLSGATGQVLGVAVDAAHTVTIGFPKPGLVSSPGFTRCGALTIAEIGMPPALAEAQGVSLLLLEPRDARALLPELDEMAHKGTRGHALMVAGGPGKRGAGRLAARAALRAGAGLVTLAGPGGDEGAPDEVMTEALDPPLEGVGEALAELAAGKRCVAIGPGMPRTEVGRALVFAALALDTVVVIDADGLNHLGTELPRVASARARVVLTPHPGEAGRLLGTSAGEVEDDRVAAVRELAHRSGAVVVLKGARTLVCDGRTTTINPTGNPGMGSGGTGDVLTGVIAAYAAQGLAPADAARLGVYLHGRAGDLAAQGGAFGLLADDLTEALPAARDELQGSRG